MAGESVIDISKPLGSRITSLSVTGKSVAETDSFTIALNNYRQTGGGGYAVLNVVPRAWTHLLAVVSGQPIPTDTEVPLAWREEVGEPG